MHLILKFLLKLISLRYKKPSDKTNTDLNTMLWLISMSMVNIPTIPKQLCRNEW